MFRIRFHGRGGQGIKTASRILGTAFFLSGYEVQDAPRYGAERRGAPLFGYVRADRLPILERGIISRPCLVVVVDETLLHLPAAGVLAGLLPSSTLLVFTDKSVEEIRSDTGTPASVIVLKKKPFSRVRKSFPMAGCCCSAAAARLAGISLEIFQEAMTMELKIVEPSLRREECLMVEEVYRQVEAGGRNELVTDRNDKGMESHVKWIQPVFDGGRRSVPAVSGGPTSMLMKTGDWRTSRPVLRQGLCNGCGLCYAFCPDGVISLVTEKHPDIDYEHCKGCLICMVQCPRQAIVTEAEFSKEAHDA